MIGHFVFAVVLTLASAAAAQPVDAEREYRACMAEARSKPQAGFDRAVQWLGLGGGDAARHCQAVALIGLGQPAEAARRLEAMAQDIRAEAGFRAELFAQAAQAWMLAGKAAQAEAVLAAALKLDPGDAELRLDHAQAVAAQGELTRAVADLTAVLAQNPDKVDALVFRASAYRQLGRTDLASADLTAALALQPGHIEALLERGMLNRLGGNAAAARRDWLTVIARAPDSAAARAAQENLQRMDGGAEQPTAGK